MLVQGYLEGRLPVLQLQEGGGLEGGEQGGEVQVDVTGQGS